MEETERIWILLAKKMSLEATREELGELEELLKIKKIENLDQTISSLEYFHRTVEEAGEGSAMREKIARNKRSILSSFYEEDPEEPWGERKAIRIHSRQWWIGIAASVVIVLFAWQLLKSGGAADGLEMNTIVTKSLDKTFIMLPDGSEVWLNGGSKLTYEDNFNRAAKREVYLTGEAYFRVKHDDDHPFIIHTRDMKILDLGTSFNVRAYPDEDKSETALIEGSITVSLLKDPGKEILLKPGEKITYRGKEKETQAENTADKQPMKDIKREEQTKLEIKPIHRMVLDRGDTVVVETAWLKNQLVFDNENFEDLALLMNKYFDAEIEFDNEQIKQYSFTGIFEDENLEQALKELQLIRPFEFKMKAGRKAVIK